MNGKRNAAVLGIYTLPGANAVEVAGQVRETMKERSVRIFPKGLDYEILFRYHQLHFRVYPRKCIKPCSKRCSGGVGGISFAPERRASLVPLIAVPISLIGTFGVMLVLGFSLNLLTLLGLILSIGIVVDDAIVVVEAVGSYMGKKKV